jgi:hypothetical protein
MHGEMTLRFPPPDEESVKREISKLFTHGDIKAIAEMVQRDKSLVSRMLSANCEDKNNIVSFGLKFQWAFDCHRRQLGDAITGIIQRERSKWLCEGRPILENPARLTRCVGLELMEAIEKELEDADRDTQIKEWSDVKVAVDKKLNDLIAKRNSKVFGLAA